MADPQSNAATSAYQLPEPLALPPDAPRAGVLHVRHRHTERYTVVGNHLAQHPSLSAVAIGVGVHIQSLPDGASVTIKALAARFPEGEVTMGRALRELEAAGYLVRCRVPLGGGRIATRTVFVERPGATAAARVPVRDSARVSAAAAVREVTPAPVVSEPPAPGPVVPREKPEAREPVTEPVGKAADLLVRLRLADARLLLSVRDVHRLLPAVETWLARSATPDQITRTLTAGLPPEGTPIHHPARFLEHRLSTLLPPPLPSAPREAMRATERPAPMTNCDDCDRGIRSHEPKPLCRDCRDARVRAAA